MNPSKHSLTVSGQLFKLIPRNLIPGLAMEYGVAKKSHRFSPNSHVLALMHAQLSHSISLNDVCDSLRNHEGALSSIRGAVAPSRNALSNTNRVRNADMAEALFWAVPDHLRATSPGFGFGGRRYGGIPRRFKRTINVVDSTTLSLVANCMDWAKHRRRKAAAKMHLGLDLGCFLPEFVLVKSASTNDLAQSYEVCAGIRPGEIVVFDKAYVGYEHLWNLNEQGVVWVTRCKENTQYEVVGQQEAHPECERRRTNAICPDSRQLAKNYEWGLATLSGSERGNGPDSTPFRNCGMALNQVQHDGDIGVYRRSMGRSPSDLANARLAATLASSSSRL